MTTTKLWSYEAAQLDHGLKTANMGEKGVKLLDKMLTSFMDGPYLQAVQSKNFLPWLVGGSSSSHITIVRWLVFSVKPQEHNLCNCIRL